MRQHCPPLSRRAHRAAVKDGRLERGSHFAELRALPKNAVLPQFKLTRREAERAVLAPPGSPPSRKVLRVTQFLLNAGWTTAEVADWLLKAAERRSR